MSVLALEDYLVLYVAGSASSCGQDIRGEYLFR